MQDKSFNSYTNIGHLCFCVYIIVIFQPLSQLVPFEDKQHLFYLEKQ